QATGAVTTGSAPSSRRWPTCARRSRPCARSWRRDCERRFTVAEGLVDPDAYFAQRGFVLRVAERRTQPLARRGRAGVRSCIATSRPELARLQDLTPVSDLSRHRPQRAPRRNREHEVEHEEAERDDTEHGRDAERAGDDAADHRPRDLAEVEAAVEERCRDAMPPFVL